MEIIIQQLLPHLNFLEKVKLNNIKWCTILSKVKWEMSCMLYQSLQIQGYQEVARRLNIMPEETNISEVNFGKTTSIKFKKK